MTRTFDAVVIGCSAGGLEVLRPLVAALPARFPLPVIIASHISPEGGGLLAEVLSWSGALPIVEPHDKQAVLPGHVYIAPANYHLLVEAERTFALSVDEQVCYARPSIDVLFMSAADVWGPHLVGVLLTGANADGAAGLKAIREAGGLTIVQDPATAFADAMPNAAIQADAAQFILPVDEIISAVPLLPLGKVPT